MKQLAILTILLAACGGAADPPPASPATASDPVLALGEVVLLDGEQPFLKLHADGTSELALRDAKGQARWRTGPTVATDGTIVVDGAAAGQLRRDDERWTAHVDGRVVDLDVATVAAKVRAEGADPAARQTAVALWTAMLATLDHPGRPVQLGAITIHDRRRPFLRLHADGRVEESRDGVTWTAGPTLRADGTVEHGGRAVARIGGPDGRPRPTDPALAEAMSWRVIDGDGPLRLEQSNGDSIHLGTTGELVVQSVDPDTGAPFHDRYGSVDAAPALRGTAMWLLGLYHGGEVRAWQAP